MIELYTYQIGTAEIVDGSLIPLDLVPPIKYLTFIGDISFIKRTGLEELMEAIQSALRIYLQEWQNWLKSAEAFDFAALKPMHVGWKVSDESALSRTITDLLPQVRASHLGTVDSRKIALLVPCTPVEGVPVLQIMQLRPASKDATGLDHVAFYCANMEGLKVALQNFPEKWEEQSNHPTHTWISIWWGPNKREAKFFDHTSLDLGARELTKLSASIKANR